jgi:hypothetical protein
MNVKNRLSTRNIHLTKQKVLERKKKRKMKLLTGCIAAPLMYVSVFAIIGLVCFAPLEYTTEYWLSYFKEESVDLDARYVYVAACVPPVGPVGGLVGGAVTLLLSTGIENPYYVSN